MKRETEPLRNDALRRALDAAIRTGDARELVSLLARHGGLPGPRPNHDLAAAFAGELAALGQRADRLVRGFAEMGDDVAPPHRAEAFLPIVAAHAYAARIARGVDAKASWDALQTLAGDARRLVREGVVEALARLGRGPVGADRLAHELAAWTDGFLQGAVAIEALARREVLDEIRDVDALLARLDEATTLVEDAPRAAERTQGRRRLLEVLAAAIPVVAARFPAGLEWAAKRAATKQPELRAAFEEALLRLGKIGEGATELDLLRRALDESAPPRRDPTTYKGPTRGRGRKAQRRSERR